MSSAARELQVGDRCVVGAKRGVVQFVGETKFAPGKWIGVVLDVAEGKNDGSVQGERYFACEPNFGLFVKHNMAKLDTQPATEPESKQPALVAAVSQPATTKAASSLSLDPTHIRKSSTGPISTAPVSPGKHLRQPSSSVTSRSSTDDSKSLSPRQPPSPRSARSPHSPSPRAASKTASPLDKQRQELFKLQENRQQLQQAPQLTPLSQTSPAVTATPPTQPAPIASTVPLVPLADFKRLEAELREAQARASGLQERLSGLEGVEAEVEVLTLDKQLKEEEVEELQLELEEEKERHKQLEEEVQRLRASADKTKEDVLSTLSVTADQREALRLSEQNKQLSSALRSLRDLTVSEKERNKVTISALEEEVKRLKAVEEEHKTLLTRHARLEKEVVEYKQHLDEASEYEQMVEHLTERNLQLSEQAKQQSERVTFLQSLNEASEEVEESHIELEQTLTHELEQKERDYADLQAKLRYKEQQAEEANRTVRQFRELVRGMETEMRGLREAEVSRSVEKGGGGRMVDRGGQQQSVLLLSQLKDMRVQYVKEELAVLDADEYKQRYDFLCSYLPENVAVDERSIDALVCISRVRGKVQLLLSVVHDYYTGKHLYAKNDELTAFAYNLLLLLVELLRVADVVSHALRSLTTVEEWQQVVSGARELAQVEGDLDAFVSLVQQDAVNEMTGVSTLVHAWQGLIGWAESRLAVGPARVDRLVDEVKEQASDKGEVPFSVSAVYVGRRYVVLPDARQQKEREAEEDAALQRLTKAIEERKVHLPPTQQLLLHVDARSLLYSCQLLSAVMEQAGDVLQAVSSARRDAQMRDKRMRELEDQSALAEGRDDKRRNDLMDAVNGGGAATADAIESSAYHRLFLSLEDVNGNTAQIAQQTVQLVTSMQLQGRQVARERRDEAMRLVLLAGLRVQRCVSEMGGLLTAIKGASVEERVEKVRMVNKDEEERLVQQLQQLLEPHVTASASSLCLSHEITQLKATMLELSRTLAVTADLPAPPPSLSHPSLVQALSTRSQLEASASTRISLQEMTARLSEKARELVSVKVREQEMGSKVSVLQRKVEVMGEKVTEADKLREEAEESRKKEEEAKGEAVLVQEELDKFARENKALRKQLLKLKHAQLKKEGEGAVVSTGGAAVGAAGGGVVSEDVQLLHATIRLLRQELTQARSQRAREALLYELAPTTAQPGKAAVADEASEEKDKEWLRGLRSQLNTLHTQLVDLRVNARIVDITHDSPPPAEDKTATSTHVSAAAQSPSEHARRAALLGQLRLATRQVGKEWQGYVDRKRTESYRGTYISTPAPPLRQFAVF